jgi:zinc transport system substrate-binding protein
MLRGTMVKKYILVMMMLISAMLLASCQNKDRDVYQIVTTLFPQYDIAKAIAGNEMSVKNVLPFGTDPHSYEITSIDRQYIESSELFIYTSDELENWVDDISLTQTLVLNLELELDLEHHNHAHEEHDDDHDEEHDVHFWTNPHTMEDMVTVILAHLIEIKPSSADLFKENANAYIETLESHVADLESFLSNYNNDTLTLYIAGHNAMAEFGEYFGLDIVSLFPDFIPDAELSSLELSSFMDALIINNIKAFFIEPVFDQEPLAAITIQSALLEQNQTVSYYELHQFHNISQQDFENNVTLFDIFDNNIQNIKLVIEENYGTR